MGGRKGEVFATVKIGVIADKQAEIERLAVASEAFEKFAAGATPKKVVVVPGRLVNLVV